MDTQDNNIKIFALTDCHQEARKLCCLFTGIVNRSPKNGKNILICDCGDLFKGLYAPELCVKSYLTLRNLLPEAKIVIAVGNNDFGFNSESLKFLQTTAKTFNKANIHVLCANLRDLKTNTYPSWVDPYILLNINNKKVLVTSFCINYIKLQKYGLQLIDIKEAFIQLKETVNFIKPDLFIVLNHALMPTSLELVNLAKQNDIKIDLIIGGHEHSLLQPDAENNIYYPYAFSRTLMCFTCSADNIKPELSEIVTYKQTGINPVFEKPLQEYETSAGLNVPIALSVLNLERQYASPCPIGTFIADAMRKAAHTDIAIISTGYIVHALRYEPNKMLTLYNIERVFSAETPLQTVKIKPDDLKLVFINALRYRYIQKTGNTRFLQASQNITVICKQLPDNLCTVKQIFINNLPLFNEDGVALHPETEISCALDPFIGSGELGFDTLRLYPKETLIKNQKLVRIKDLFLNAVRKAPEQYSPGYSYPSYKIIDL